MSDGPATTPESATDETTLYCPKCGYNLTGLPQDRCPECGLEGAVARAALEGSGPRYRRYKRVCLAVMGGIFLLGGILDGLAPEMPAQFLAGFLLAVVSLIWCHCDAVVQGCRVGKTVGVLVLLCIPLGLSIYLLSQRRWWSLCKAIGFAIALGLLSAVVSEVTFFLCYGYWRPV